MQGLGGGGARWLRIVARGGLFAVARELSHGDRGWEIAGKGAALVIGALVCEAVFYPSSEPDLSDPLRLVIAVAAVGGLIAFGVGLTRESRLFLRRLRKLIGRGQPVTAVRPLGSEESGEHAMGTRGVTSSSDPGVPAGPGVADIGVDADHAPHVVTESNPSTPNEWLSGALSPSGNESLAASDEVAEGPGDLERRPSETTAGPSTTRSGAGTRLNDAIRRNQQGRAAENYVAQVLGDVPRSRYRVVSGLLFKREEIGRHVGDIDFVVLRQDGSRLVTIEVKSTPPWAQGSDGRPCRESFCEQAARQAVAVRTATEGAVAIDAVVTYVPPRALPRTVAEKMRTLPPREHAVQGMVVHSVGVKGLKDLIRELHGDSGSW